LQFQLVTNLQKLYHQNCYRNISHLAKYFLWDSKLIFSDNALVHAPPLALMVAEQGKNAKKILGFLQVLGKLVN